MPGNTDRRIIEMQFENKQFEKNIAKSTKSVEDLKQAMDFEETSKGLKKFADSTKNLTLAGFEKLNDNIQKLTDKFTGLGTLSELVLSQIRRGIESVARDISGFINSMTTVQVSAGMNKYEMLNKSVQTIMAATGKSEETVYKVLDRLNSYTDQTSYNFSDMASNIGKFTSVGIDLESAERQMEGIANWAARSGAGINEASRAMYNLSQAMGVGKLTKIDWKSIENAGMATKEFKEQLIEAGIEAGTLKKKGEKIFTQKGNVEVSYKNVAETLAKGWADSSVLSATLEKYYYDDLYYENEQESILKLNEAQKESFDKMIESGEKLDASEWKHLKNTGAITDETAEKIVNLAATQGKLTKETKEDGTTIYKTVNKTGKQIEFTLDNLEESLESGWFDKGVAKAVTSVNSLAKESYEAAQKCLTFTDVLGAWKDQISTGWMTSYKLIFGELSEAMSFFSDVCNRVGDSLGELIDFRNDILKGWNESGGRNSLIELIVGNYGDNAAEGAYGFLDMLDSVGRIIKQGFTDFMMLFMDPAQKLKMKDDPEYLRKWMSARLLFITDQAKEFMKNIKKFFTEDIKVNGKTTNRLEIIKNIVDGIAGALKLGYDILTGVIEFIGMIGEDLGPGLNEVIGFIGDLGKSIYDTSDEVGKENRIHLFFVGLREDIKPVTDSINDLLVSIVGLLRIIFGLNEEGATQTETLHNIGSILRTIVDIVSKIAGPIIKFVSRIIDAISNLVKNGVNGDTLKQFGQDLANGFSEMMTAFADNLPDSMGFMKDWVHGIFGGAKEEAEGETKTLFGMLKNTNKEAKEFEKEAEKNQGSTGPGLMGLMTGSNIAVWLGVASLASVVLLLRKARKVVGAVGSFIGGLGDTLKNGLTVKFKDESFATKFIKIAAAIALVAASIYALGTMPLSALIQGGIAVAVVCGVMFGMFKLLQKSAAKGSFKDQLAFAAQVTALAFGMMALSVAVGMMALALIPFTLMSWEQYGKAMAGLGGILLELAAFMAIIKVLKIGNVKLAGFAGFAIGIGLIVQGITPFANMSWDQYGKAMAGLGGVLLQLVAFMGLMRLLDIGTKGIKLAGIVAFSIAIVLLVQAIKPFANMTWDQYGKVMAGLGGVLLELIAFMGLLRLLDIGTKGIKLSGVISFALAIVILIQAILPFKDMTWDQYARVMAGLGGVLLELIAFMGLMRLLDIGTKGIKLSGVISFALAIVILIQAILPFKDMTWEQYAKVMAGLGGVLLEILAFMGLMRLMDIGTKGIKLSGFILFVIGLKLLIDSIMPFTTMSWDQYAKAMAGLGGMLLELLVFMGIMKLIGSRSLDIAAFMPFAYGIQALVTAIIPFASMSWEDYAKTMAGLAGVLAIMLGFMALLKLVKPSVKNMLQMAIFAGIFAAVAGVFGVVLGLVKDMDWKVIAAFSAGLTSLVVGMSVAAALASVIGLKGFLILAAGIAIIVAAISLVLPLLSGSLSSSLNTMAGSLNYITAMFASFSETMNGLDEGSAEKGENMIERMKGMFESVLGMGNYSAAISTFSTAMYDLATGFQIFHNHTKDILDPKDNAGLKLINELAAAAPNIKTLASTNISDLTSKLEGLGGAMMLYAQGAKEATGLKIGETPDVTAAVGLLTAISTSLVDEKGKFVIPEDMPDETKIGNFGSHLAALAAAMVKFEAAGKDLGTGTENAKRTLTFFKELKKDLDEDFRKNLYQAVNIFGETNSEMTVVPSQLEKFGKNIEQLGLSMKAFADSTTETDKVTGEIKPVNYDKAIEALKAFSDLENKLPTIGGIGSWFAGNHQTLVDLGGQIQTLGGNLMNFSNDIQNGKPEEGILPFDYEKTKPAITLADDMVKMLQDLKTKLPRVGGLWNILKSTVIGREFDLTDLGAQIGKLGEGLGTMGENLNKGNWADNTGTKNAFETLNAVIQLMVNIQSFYTQLERNSWDGTDAFAAFSNLSDFISYFVELDKDGNNISNNGKTLIEQISDFMKAIDTELTGWADENDDTLEHLISRMEAFKLFAEGINALTSSTGLTTDWKFIGNKLTSDVATSITEGTTSVSDAVGSMIRDSYTAGSSIENGDWEQLGKNIVDGVATGITAEGPVTLWPSVKQMMKDAYDRGKEAIDSNSPSKLFMQLGAFMGEGTAIGIEKSSKEVSDASGAMGEVALDSASNMLGLISRIMAEGTDTSPTISPILDMTNIDAGMAAFRESLNGYGINLDTSYSAGRAARIGTNTYEDPNALKPDYSGIYNEMRMLGTRIEQMGREIHNMKLVLDTGAVAGGVADILDEEYGRREFYASREG